MDFHHKHVIITGGSSGIGRAIARLLAERDAHISVIARRQELLNETLSELENLRPGPAQRMMVYSADLAEWEQAKQAICALTAELPPDVLINNAGFAHPGYFEELPLDIFHKTMDIDYFGTVYATKATVPMMIERKTGHIVNVASMAGFLGVFGYTPYTPAKFAVRGFTESLRQELKPHGIHVSIVFPPDTDTPQLRYENQFKPPETLRISGTIKPQTADQVARSIIRGIERRKTYITPGFDPWLYFVLFNGPIRLFHWYCDRLVAKTQREQKAS